MKDRMVKGIGCYNRAESSLLDKFQTLHELSSILLFIQNFPATSSHKSIIHLLNIPHVQYFQTHHFALIFNPLTHNCDTTIPPYQTIPMAVSVMHNTQIVTGASTFACPLKSHHFSLIQGMEVQVRYPITSIKKYYPVTPQHYLWGTPPHLCRDQS